MDKEILEQNPYSIIIALSENEIGKVTLPDRTVWTNQVGEIVDMKAIFGYKDPTTKSEAIALQYANGINDLMPKYIREDTWQMQDGTTADMLVMERLYILPIDHFEMPIREKMLDDFERKMKELHDNLFIHGDFMRPTNVFTRNNYEWKFKNIVQTAAGLRLIDTGFSKIRNRENVEKFVYGLIEERNDIKVFREYYLGRVKTTPFKMPD